MAVIKLVNPRRRGGRRSPRRKSRVHRNPVARRSRRRSKRRVYSNPKSKRRSYRRSSRSGGLFSGGLMKGTLIPAITGAAGAIATDAALGFLPIPDAIKTGPLRPLARLGVAWLVGKGAGMVTSRHTGNVMTAGAVLVIAYDVIKSAVGSFIPGVLSEYVGLGYTGAGLNVGLPGGNNTVLPMGEYVGAQY